MVAVKYNKQRIIFVHHMPGERMKNIFYVILFLSSNVYTCQKWPYLQSSAFKKARQERVAQMVAGCDMVVEIGGAGAPMSGFLDKKTQVIVIDPEIKRKEEGNVKHIPIGFEKWDERPISKNYAVVILGLQLEMPDGAWQKLHELISGSAITIIEYAAQNKEARKQFKDIKQSTQTKEWQEPEEFEICGHELNKFKGHVFNHRVLQCATQKQKEQVEEQQ